MSNQYRKKPVVIEAEQFTQEKLEAYFFDNGELPHGLLITASHIHPGDRKIWSYRAGVKTLEGFMTADIGDWIIKGVKGEHYPCKPDIFAATYESAAISDAAQAPVEMSPEFTDSARAALVWVLYHHQGGSSPVGQPIRFALGMGAHEPLTPSQIGEALKLAEASRWPYARELPRAAPAIPQAAGDVAQARDAARYRLIRAGFGDFGPDVDLHNAFVDGGDKLDAALDKLLPAAAPVAADAAAPSVLGYVPTDGPIAEWQVALQNALVREYDRCAEIHRVSGVWDSYYMKIIGDHIAQFPMLHATPAAAQPDERAAFDVGLGLSDWPSENHECVYEHGDGVCRECAALAELEKVRSRIEQAVVAHCTGDDLWIATNLAARALFSRATAPQATKGETCKRCNCEWSECRCGCSPTDDVQPYAEATLTQEQREAIEEAICWANGDGLPGTGDMLRTILDGGMGRATAPQATVKGDERRPAKSHCQNGGDVCLAGNRDGVCCPEDSCDIDDGIRAAASQAGAKLTEEVIVEAVKKWFPDRSYQASFFARSLLSAQAEK